MSTLFLVRGLPGSGKSTLAQKLCDVVFAADDFFVVGGIYKFQPELLSYAHKRCQINVEDLIRKGKNVAVANTFTTAWEAGPYFLLAEKYKANVVVVDLYDGGLNDEQLAARNVHGVPVEAISRMRNRWESNIRTMVND